MSETIDKLLADYCTKFIKTGELDEAMLVGLQAYADANRGRFEHTPRHPPLRVRRGRPPKISTPAPVAQTLRDWLLLHPVKPPRKRMGPRHNKVAALKADWDRFCAEKGMARGTQKTIHFIGPRFPRGHVNKLFAAWRKSCPDSSRYTPASLASSLPIMSPTPGTKLLASFESADT